jgi:stage II sporulation protein D
MADFYVKNNTLCAAVIKESVTPEAIRVVIGTGGFTSLVHESISITSDTPFTVTAGSVVKKYAPGHPFKVNKLENSDLFGYARVFITSDEQDGSFQISTVERSGKVTYRGRLEIAAETGGWSIVNELPLEEYLYSVVPSEMPDSYGLEAAMVQAVTARSYAYNQFYENRFHAYGAHVDDSVSSQVYNNIPETTLSVEAVTKTAGQCLTWLGQVISANFYSTSSGVTANSGDVWPGSGGKEFPGETPPYLRSQALLMDGAKLGDLSKEENVRKFLMKKDASAYDSGFSWFRWHVEMTAEELAASINANLPARMAANPSLIIVEKGDAAKGIGELIGLEVLKRGEGGNIMELRIKGTLATLRVLTEYNVRTLLCPRRYIQDGRDIVIYRGDGTYVTNYSLMPSAFFVIEDGYTFHGGGNGHGVGMSQNAVKGMADLGFSFDEILEKFYPGTEVAVVS